jgi:radical SAM superfamily enzyme YgiQ (UPF0313 family)
MRTILLNLPWRENGRLGVRAGSRWPFSSEPEKSGYINYIPFPFFLAYATSLLKKEDKEAKLIDAIAEGIDEQKVMEEIESYNPDLMLIEISTPSFNNDIRLARNIHQKLSNCHIALCGPHATVFAKDILNKYNFINYILMGEYEYTLLDLVKSLEGKEGLESVSGLAYRNRAKIIINRLRSTMDNLDDLPWPEREGVPIYKYNDGFCGLPRPNVQMWTSRGCPFQCIFCLWPQTIYKEHKYRKRNHINVVDEMEWLIRNFDFKAIYFDDDVFNIDKTHVLNICEEIKKREINVPWAVMARADLMDEALLDSMADAGLYAIKYGVESASVDILNLCKKDMNLHKAVNMIRHTKKIGVKVHLTFCLGLPGETRETIQETVNFIEETKPDSLQFSFATPFPGTEYLEYLNKNGNLFSKYWPDYDGNYKCVVETQELSVLDLEKVRDDLNNNLNFQ